MEEFEVPTLESIAEESDRASLADTAKKIRAYGVSLVENASAENVETLRELASRLDAVNARITELKVQEDEAAAKVAEEAAELAGLKTVFAKEDEPVVEVEKAAPKALKIPAQVEELTVDEKKETVSEYVKRELRLTPNSVYSGSTPVTSSREFGERIVDAWREINKTKVAGRTSIKLFSADVQLGDAEFRGGEAAEYNFQVIRDKVIPSAYAAANPDMEESIVASGGYCAPLNTDYSIPTYSEICSTLEDFLPVVRAPRGGIKFLRPPTDTTAAGVAVITCAEDAAGYVCEDPPGTTPCKPVATITCPTTDEACVDIITWAIKFGNLNYMTFPELVDWALHQLMVNQNRVKQTYLLNKINNAADVVAVTSATVQYGAVYHLLEDLMIVGARYRNQYRMCYGTSTLDLLLPRFVLDLLRLDLMARPNGTDFLTLSEADVRGWFRSFGYNVYFYEGAPTGEYAGGDPVGPLTAGAAVADLPTKVVAYIMIPGAWTILHNGTLDFGVVRDSLLNHANNLEIMAEEFIGAARTGEKPIKLTSTLCPNGSFSAGTTTMRTCA